MFAMPKFTMAYDRIVTETSRLSAWRGVHRSAKFSGMSTQPLKLSFVKQKAFVTVDETGTTAGASTVTGVSVTALREFRVDHPFIFVIPSGRPARSCSWERC